MVILERVSLKLCENFTGIGTLLIAARNSFREKHELVSLLQKDIHVFCYTCFVENTIWGEVNSTQIE